MPLCPINNQIAFLSQVQPWLVLNAPCTNVTSLSNALCILILVEQSAWMHTTIPYGWLVEIGSQMTYQATTYQFWGFSRLIMQACEE